MAGTVSGSYDPAASSPPRFYQLPGWESLLADSVPTSDAGNPASLSVARLCRYFHVAYEAAAARSAGGSPLAWPVVFADEAASPRGQRQDIASQLAACGLAFREITPLDLKQPREMADSLVNALIAGNPIVCNVTSAPIIYGYDRREPDPWWLVVGSKGTEVILESERQGRLMMGGDDPATGSVWIVSGTSVHVSTTLEVRQRDYDVLRRISRSVRGDPATGLEPYPLTLRALRDRLAQTDSLPRLAEPIVPTDPIGAIRAAAARDELNWTLERIMPSTRDTALQVTLRLAQYFCHNSAEKLHELADLMYDSADVGTSLQAVRSRWANPKIRNAADGILGHVLEWEKRASGAIDSAIAIYDKPAPKKTPPPRKRTRGKPH